MKVVVLYRWGGGFGDGLMMTAVARAFRSQYPDRRVVVIHRRPALFRFSPSVWAAFRPFRGLRHLGTWAERGSCGFVRFARCEYEPYVPRLREGERRHLVQLMGQHCGVEIDAADVYPEYDLALEEAHRPLPDGLAEGEYVVLQSQANLYHTPNKNWQPENFQALVDLNPHVRFAQVGRAQDPPLRRVVDLRGRLSVPQLAGIIASARTCVLLEGFLMHLAAALRKPSVVIYGGYLHPDQSGYPIHDSIYVPTPCAPCWLTDRCPFDRRCMSAITPETVSERLRRMLAQLQTVGPGH